MSNFRQEKAPAEERRLGLEGSLKGMHHVEWYEERLGSLLFMKSFENYYFNVEGKFL